MHKNKNAKNILVEKHFVNLSYDNVLKTPSYDRGEGGGLNVSPPFLFAKTIEKVIILCTVWKKKFDW